MSHHPQANLLTANQSTGLLDTLIDLLEIQKKAKLANDAFTDQTSLGNIGLGFTPLANKDYLLDATLLVQSASDQAGPAIGWAGPTGITAAAAVIEGPTAETTYAARALTGIPGTALTLATFPTANETYVVRLRGIVRVGATPGAGDVRLQFASSAQNTEVRIKAGSILLYRVV